MQYFAKTPYLNGLIVVKLKQDLNYRGYVYSISEGLSSKEIIVFSDIDEHQDVAKSI